MVKIQGCILLHQIKLHLQLKAVHLELEEGMMHGDTSSSSSLKMSSISCGEGFPFKYIDDNHCLNPLYVSFLLEASVLQYLLYWIMRKIIKIQQNTLILYQYGHMISIIWY